MALATKTANAADGEHKRELPKPGPQAGITDDGYDEDADHDFDPAARDAVSESESDSEQPDYSHVAAASSQVRTRRQRAAEQTQKRTFGNVVGAVSRDLDVDELFSSLRAKSVEGRPTDWAEVLGRQDDEPAPEGSRRERGIYVEREKQTPEQDAENPKIWINVSYQFAGKLVTESKQVDANSAEARAYLNSTAGLLAPLDSHFRTSVPVIRTVPGASEPVELKIKLKRPLLIDKFLGGVGSKKHKLSTLEKSRLDWASFVDTSQISDELKLHNKAGYLEKQDFLHRLEARRDRNYVQARDAEKARQWQQQQ